MPATSARIMTQKTTVPAKWRSVSLECLLVFVGFFALTIILTWPLFPNMRTHAAQLGDYLLVTYIQAWVAHALATHPTHLLDMNMLYPSRHILAASENLIGNQLVFGPAYALTGKDRKST